MATGVIRAASTKDVAWVVSLQKVWSNAVGFLTRQAIRAKIARGQGVLIAEGGQEAGYLLHSSGRDGVLCCSQVAVSRELLRTELGTELVHELERRAVERGLNVIRLRCREELEANLFWKAVGFETTAVIGRGSARGFRIVEWTKAVDVEVGINAGRGTLRSQREPSAMTVRSLRIQSVALSPVATSLHSAVRTDG
jgi:N-acetylglutamate synthase-like GNAT family acetyltransferase